MSIISTEKEYVELIHPSVIKARRQTYLKRGVLGEKLPLVIPITLEGFEAEINGLIQGDFSEQFKKRLTLQKWHENGDIVTYQDIEEAKTGVIEELRKPIEGARYARVGIHFIEKNSDTLVLRWNPTLGKWNRLTLPGNLLNWKQYIYSNYWYKWGHNPWRAPIDVLSPQGFVSMLTINTLENFVFHDGDYTWAGINLSGNLGGLAYKNNWQLDTVNHKFSFEFYIDNENEEHSPNVLYDDDETFWTITGSGSGTISVSGGEETSIVKKGTSSLKVQAVSGGTYANILIYHQWVPYRDWSSYDFLCLYIYGQNTGRTIGIYLLTPGWADYGGWFVTDNWSGWKRIILPLRKPDQKVGNYSLSQIQFLDIIFYNVAANETWYVDRVLVDVGKWVKVECFVPDYIKDILDSVKLYFWNPNTNNWVGPATFNGEKNTNPSWNGTYFVVLNGNNFEDFYGGGTSGAAAFTFYGKAGRGETISHSWGSSLDPNGAITYSNYYGCKKRIGFAIKMPPDDGQDSSTYGISQCRLKLEVYYDKGESGFWGEATYEFENSTNGYYGLQNIDKPYIALWHDAEKRANFIILPNTTVGDGLPSRLEITADENENIVKVVVGWASQKTGDLKYGLDLTDPTLDSDGDGIPDVIENIENYVGGLS
jgi:hypothetical protein